MSRVGGDIEQLAGLKRTFDTQAQNVNTLTRELSNAVANAWWIGPHADRFKQEWQGTYQTTLNRLEETLRQLGMEVEQKRAQLEAAGR